jgi:hypothetical protein
MKIVQQLAEQRWRDFLADHPHSQIFHTPEMFRVFAQTKGHRPTLWAAVDDQDMPLALLLPVEITLRDGLLERLTTRAVVYGSVLCAPGADGQAALRLLLQSYKQSNKESLFTELRNLSDLTELQPILQEQGFVYEDHLNYLIDLNRSPDEIMASISKSMRKRIRQGLQDGTTQVSEIQRAEELGLWYETLQKTYTHARVPLADYSLFEATFVELVPKGMAKFFLVTAAGAPAACSVILIHKDIIYAWYAGSDRAYSKYNPNEMQKWHVLAWGATHGYRLYDFGGAGKPNEAYGPREFKAKFHGKLVCFGRNICVHHTLALQLSKFGYSLYRKLQ